MATEESITPCGPVNNNRSTAPIYLSYSNQTGFIERYFVVRLHQQLVENGLGEGVLWFDHSQGIHPDKSVTWFADRLEAIDLSLGSLLILSDACQHQRLMTIESKAILDRKLIGSSNYTLLVILLDECRDFAYLRSQADFSYGFSSTETLLNVDERISIVVGHLLGRLQPYKQLRITTNRTLPNTEEEEENEEKKPITDEQQKPLCVWTTKEIQTFLTRVGVHEVSRDLFAEKQIDGYLLLSCTEQELKKYFQMNNHKVRQTLIERVIQTIQRERQTSSQWHYKANKSKGKTDHIYLIYDPEDHPMACQIIAFLKAKHFRVFTHNPRYGRTKQEFLATNGPTMARTKDVIYLLTNKSSRSTFTFHELTLAEWFEKPIVTVYVENVWANMRSSIRALLAEYPSVDFIHQSFNDSLSILHAYLRPYLISADEPADYAQKLKQTVKPLVNMAASNSSVKQHAPTLSTNENHLENSRFIYLSYSNTNEKWNVVHAMERLVFILEAHHFQTGIQINSINTSRENDPHHLPKIQMKASSVSTTDSHLNGTTRTSAGVSSNIRHSTGTGDIRHCRVMLVCLTPKYFRNEQCLNELRLCELYQKPLLVCILRQMTYNRSNIIGSHEMNIDEQINRFVPSKLPTTTLNFLRKHLRSTSIDLSTNELFARNAQTLLRRLEGIVGRDTNTLDSPTTGTSLNPKRFSQPSEVF